MYTRAAARSGVGTTTAPPAVRVRPRPAAPACAAVVIGLARDSAVADATRLRAAISVVEMMARVTDAALVDQRLLDLESRMAALDAGGTMDLTGLVSGVLAPRATARPPDGVKYVVRLDRLTEGGRTGSQRRAGHVATGEALAYLAERQRVLRAVVAEWCGSEGLAERGEEVRRALTVVGDGFRLDLLEAEEALAEAVEHPLTDEAAQDGRLHTFPGGRAAGSLPEPDSSTPPTEQDQCSPSPPSPLRRGGPTPPAEERAPERSS